jgi:hypothetical protein
MTTVTYHVSASDVFSRIAAYVCDFAEGAREGQQIATRYHKLSRLSSAELARRGLNRQTIARAALTGR